MAALFNIKLLPSKAPPVPRNKVILEQEPDVPPIPSARVVLLVENPVASIVSGNDG